jgi:hypothetical protein
MKKTWYKLLSIVVVAGAFSLSVYMVKSKKEPRKDSTTHNTLNVKAAKIKPSNIEYSSTYRGRITAFENVAVISEVSGRLMKGDIRLKEGERFKKNDVIVNIYNEDIVAGLQSSISSFMQVLADILPDIKVDYSSEYDKWYRFFNALDPQKKLPELPAINSNQEKVFLAANSVLSSYFTLKEKEITLSKYHLVAPFNGSITGVNKEIGSATTAGSEIATIIRSDKLEIAVPVFPQDLNRIHVGDTAKITTRNKNIQNVMVTRISGFVDESTQSVNIYLSYYPGSKNYLLEGEYVDVTFPKQKIFGYEIPREALVDKKYVYELNDSHLKKSPVTILRTLDDSYIIAPADSGKTIVIESLASINPNTEYVARQ